MQTRRGGADTKGHTELTVRSIQQGTLYPIHEDRGVADHRTFLKGEGCPCVVGDVLFASPSHRGLPDNVGDCLNSAVEFIDQLFPEPTRNVVGGDLRPLIGVVTIGSREGSCQLTIHDDRVSLAVVARLDVDKCLIPTLGLIGVGNGLLNIHSAVQDERVVSHRGSTELRLRESSGEVSLPVGEVYHLFLASHVEHLEVAK